jgi:transcriptional regulator with XRE-family HTH domain
MQMNQQRARISALQQMRRIQGMSLAELTSRTGIDTGTLSRLERGLRPLRVSQLYAICLATDERNLAERLAIFVQEG